MGGTVNTKISALSRDTNDFSNAASRKTSKNDDPCLDWKTTEDTCTENPTITRTYRKERT